MLTSGRLYCYNNRINSEESIMKFKTKHLPTDLIPVFAKFAEAENIYFLNRGQPTEFDGIAPCGGWLIKGFEMLATSGSSKNLNLDALASIDGTIVTMNGYVIEAVFTGGGEDPLVQFRGGNTITVDLEEFLSNATIWYK